MYGESGRKNLFSFITPQIFQESGFYAGF